VLEPGPVGVVVQDQGAIFRPDGAPERRSLHSGIERPEVVVERIQILKLPNYRNLYWCLHPLVTWRKSLGVAPNTCRILSKPESWQNSKNVLPNSSKIALAGISEKIALSGASSTDVSFITQHIHRCPYQIVGELVFVDLPDQERPFHLELGIFPGRRLSEPDFPENVLT
jgi:hypothetical protein